MRGSTGGPVCCDYGLLNRAGCVAEAGFVCLFFDEPLEGTKNCNTGSLQQKTTSYVCEGNRCDQETVNSAAIFVALH